MDVFPACRAGLRQLKQIQHVPRDSSWTPGFGIYQTPQRPRRHDQFTAPPKLNHPREPDALRSFHPCFNLQLVTGKRLTFVLDQMLKDDPHQMIVQLPASPRAPVLDRDILDPLDKNLIVNVSLSIEICWLHDDRLVPRF